jgi:competence protein ComEA
MILGGVVLILLLGGYGLLQGCRNAISPSPVVVTRQPPPDPPSVTSLAAVNSPRLPGKPAAAAPKADPVAPKSPAVADPIMVHVVGAVKQPGVYKLPAKARLLDAVRAAGGAKGGADLEAVNLASFVQDGEQIRVPTLSERALPRLAAAAARSSPPRAELSARPTRSTARYPLAAPSPVTANGSPSPDQGAAPKKMTRVVNLNTADAAELTTLPGVGPKTAAAILAYRQEHGTFQRVEDLLEIRGIGEKKLGRMRDWIVVK